MQRGKTGYLLDAEYLQEEEQVREYRGYLECLVMSVETRNIMGQAAQHEARQRSWSAAMQRLFDGYVEAIEVGEPLAVA